MADNVTIPTTGSGTATPVIATDDVSSVHFQKIKLDVGGDGASVPVKTGAGTATDTLRATLASDDPAVVALQIIDDWDESDRAKVNPIVGVAGVAAGAGAVGTTTQRVTLASDDPAVATLGATSGAKVITDATGTLQQYLRGLIYLLNQPYRQVGGSAQTVINTATDIAAGNFSGSPSATFSNNDSVVPNALYANAMAEFPDWAAAPVAGTTVDLYGVLKDVDSTDDETDAPSGTSSGGARYFGSWVIAAADALQRRTIVISLAGITSSITVDFYIKNGTAQNMNNDAGTNCVVKITPFSVGLVG